MRRTMIKPINGYLSVEFNIKSRADRFFRGYLAVADVPYTNDYVKRLEGDPSDGRRLQFSVGGFQISKWYNTLKETSIDSEVAKWQDSDSYTKLEGTMSVIHTMDDDSAGRATWTIQYEKIRDDIEDPQFIMDTTAKYFQAMDDIILSNP